MRALLPGAAQWLLVIWVACFIHDVTSRPSTSQPTQSTPPTLSTESIALEKNNSSSNLLETSTVAAKSMGSNSREDKTNTPAIGESIKMVANQLLQGNKTPPPATGEGGAVEDVRTPPRMKNQQNNKNKNPKPPTSTASAQIIESSHAGVAVPMDADDIEKPVLKPVSYSNKLTTTDEGLSTWILLSGNPTTPNPKTPMKTVELEIVVNDKKESTEEVDDGNDIKKVTENNQRPKPSAKPIRKTSTVVPIKPIFTRKPIAIGSSNKSDLIASGSAVNEKVMNKIKASVLANVQKNKFAAFNRTTTSTSQPIIEVTSTATPSQETIDVSTTEKTTTIKTPTTSTSPKLEKIKVSVEKPHKIKSKPVAIEIIESKNKVMETEMEIKANDINIESKEAEIELEVSTPQPPTTKKPKRTSNKRKKNKNRRRSKPSTTTEKPNIVIESKNNNNTKLASKIAQKEKPITTQIYNYLSREVMPSVGVGIVSIAGLVGLASYFLYPFSGVVRRAYDINDRKDDLYQQNGEQYATAEGGQTEEEMLGSFFPEEPSTKKNNRNNVNPYAGQTQFRYPQVKKVQDPNIRYRNVAHGSDTNSFLPSDRVGQQSIEQIKGAAYSEQIHYDTHMPEEEDNYSNLRYQHPQPIYKSSELNSEETAFATDSLQATYSTQDKIPDPTYEQAMRYSQEVIVNDATKSPGVGTLHLGVDDVIEQQKETGYTVAIVGAEEKQPQFVVGNVPVELVQTVTPITVPEHGPRSLRIRKRSIPVTQYEIPTYISSVADSLEEVLKKSRENESESDISNEISDSVKETTVKYQPSTLQVLKEKLPAYNPETNLPISFDVATSGMKMSEISLDNDKKENIKNKVNKNVSKDDLKKEEKKKENNFSKEEHHKEKHTDIKTIVKSSKDEPQTSGIAEILTIKNTQGSKIVIVAEDSIKSQYTSAPNIDMISIGNIGDFLSTRKNGRLETSSMTNKNKADMPTTTTTLPVVEIIEQKDKKMVSDRTQNKENIKSAADLISEVNKEDYILLSNPEKRAPLFIEITTKDGDTTDDAPTDDPLLEVTTNYKSESTSAKPAYPGTDDYPNTDPFETHPKPFSFIGFIKSLVEFKIRLGMSILQTTSDSLARYLRNMESTMKTASRTSGHLDRPYYNNK